MMIMYNDARIMSYTFESILTGSQFDIFDIAVPVEVDQSHRAYI